MKRRFLPRDSHPSIYLEGQASPHVTHIFLSCFDCQAAQLPWSSANLVGKGTQTPTRSSLSHSALAQLLHPMSLGRMAPHAFGVALREAGMPLTVNR